MKKEQLIEQFDSYKIPFDTKRVDLLMDFMKIFKRFNCSSEHSICSFFNANKSSFIFINFSS